MQLWTVNEWERLDRLTFGGTPIYRDPRTGDVASEQLDAFVRLVGLPPVIEKVVQTAAVVIREQQSGG